jgi:hypothetical protein
MGIQAEFEGRERSSTRTGLPPQAARARSSSCSRASKPSMPPTAPTANTASTITMPMAMANCTKSVTRTPQRPDSVEISEVTAIMPG